LNTVNLKKYDGAMRNRGLFVDLDGTLADSRSLLRQAYFAFLKEFGAEGSDVEFDSLDGIPLAQIVEILHQKHNIPDNLNVLRRRYFAIVRKAHALAKPANDAKMLLERARERGWVVAVVTSAPRLAAMDWLTQHLLCDFVDIVVGGDEVTSGKPAADPYQLALQQARSVAARSIALEDSRHGAQSALSAGIPTWVITPLGDRMGWPTKVNFIDGLGDVISML
jgi:HAD superfamily hydrolase (TIGR01509 family)